MPILGTTGANRETFKCSLHTECFDFCALRNSVETRCTSSIECIALQILDCSYKQAVRVLILVLYYHQLFRPFQRYKYWFRLILVILI
jgi:hypothetical protein